MYRADPSREGVTAFQHSMSEQRFPLLWLIPTLFRLIDLRVIAVGLLSLLTLDGRHSALAQGHGILSIFVKNVAVNRDDRNHAACSFFFLFRKNAAPGALAMERDTLILTIVTKLPQRAPRTDGSNPSADASQESSPQPDEKDLAASSAKIAIFFDNVPSEEFVEGDTSEIFVLPATTLSDKEVKVARANSVNWICATKVSDNPITLSRVGVDSTAFIADGAVAAGLKSGVGSSSVTGSLGIIHDSFKTPSEVPPCADREGKLGFLFTCSSPLTGEHLKAVIALAGSADTVLKGSDKATYVQAIASPSLAIHQAGSATLDLYRFTTRGGGTGTQGWRYILSVNRATWAPDTGNPVGAGPVGDTAANGAVVALSAKSISVIALDVRRRWAFIDHANDPKGNSFVFGMEVGAALRQLAGEGATRRYLTSALGTNEHFFLGGVFAVDIRLRAVTAALEMPILVHLTDHFQPTFAFRFDAPFFTL
jgi:hypothetical protein